MNPAVRLLGRSSSSRALLFLSSSSLRTEVRRLSSSTIRFARRRQSSSAPASSASSSSSLDMRATRCWLWWGGPSNGQQQRLLHHQTQRFLPSSLHEKIGVRSYSRTTILLDSSTGGDGGDDGDDATTNKNNDSNNKVDRNSKATYSVVEYPNFIAVNNTKYTMEELEKILEQEEERLLNEQKERFVPNWKPGMRRRPLTMSYSLEEFEYEMDPTLPPRWTLRDKRCGAIGLKVGMTALFEPQWGIRYPCTVLSIDHNMVMGHKTMERNGYMAVQVAAGHRKRKNVGKSVLGQYKTLFDIIGEDNYPSLNSYGDPNPPYLIREFRVTDPAHFIPVGQQIHARHFVPGQQLDVSGISKGKGFQGGMKRHNFAGLPASHGVSKSHRSIGSTGQCQDPGRVFKGKKMPGHMGHERVTVQNLRLVMVDRGRNLLFVQGAVPGPQGTFVEIRDAVKKPLWGKGDEYVLGGLDRPPIPTYQDPEEEVNKEDYKIIDGCGLPGYQVFMPQPGSDPLADEEGDQMIV